jgi:hypothetical protein
MASPCRQYLDSKSKCFRLAHSTRCGSCVLRNYLYNGPGPSASDFDKIKREHDRLQNKITAVEAAEEQVFEAQRVARAKRKRFERL